MRRSWIFFRLLLFLFGMVLCFIGAVRYFVPDPCAQALAYSIGELDERFHLSHSEFLAIIQDAELAWERASGRDIFVYDAASPFTVNLRYDERQERADRAQRAADMLEKTAQTRASIQRQYDNALSAYERAQDAYEARLAAYETDMDEFRADVQQSNAAGGASPEEYAALQSRQKALQARHDELEDERVHVNELASAVNTLAESDRKTVKTYNQGVEQYNNEFADEGEFGQGEYTGDAITIYTFTDRKNLERVLQHELGHALGIGHLPNPASVMYYLVHDEGGEFSGPIADDLAALEAQCEKHSFDVLLERLGKESTL